MKRNKQWMARNQRRRGDLLRPWLEVLEDRSLLAAGDLDTSFGAFGRVVTDIEDSSQDAASDVLIQTDGRVIAVGSTSSGVERDFALTRYHSDGTPDLSFSFDGQVVTDFGGNDVAHAAALQSDGKIVVVGETNAAPGTGETFAIARYHPDGSLDLSFGDNGKVLGEFPGPTSVARAIVIQPDGKIIVAGETTAAGPADVSQAFALVRYNTDGTLDPTFGFSGRVITDFEPPGMLFDDVAYALALLPDGKVVAAGTSGGTIALAQYLPDGTLDPAFGSAGLVRQVAGRANDVAIQSDGRIVVAAQGFSSNSTTSRFTLLRYLPHGSFDADFDADGRLTTNFAPGVELASSVVIQDDGKILAAGVAGVGGISQNFAVARYSPDGSLDASFNVDGKIQIAFGFLAEESASAMALDAGGRIVVAGTTDAEGSQDFALVRLLANPVSVFVENLALFIIGNAADNSIEIAASGRGDMTVLESGRELGTFTGIEEIVVDAQAGNDVITFSQPEIAPDSRGLVGHFDLGGGNDTFAGQLLFPPGQVTDPSNGRYELDVLGQAGADVMSVSLGDAATGPNGNLFDGNLAVNLAGGGGSDNAVIAIINVAITGGLSLGMDGGIGNDTMRVEITGSDIGPLLVDMAGGLGNDVESVFCSNNLFEGFNLSLVNGGGNDIASVMLAEDHFPQPVVVQLSTGGGNDSASVFCQNNLFQALDVTLDTGAGSDSASVMFADGHLPGHASVQVNAGAGNDRVSTEIQNVSIEGQFALGVDGGTGADRVGIIIDFLVAGQAALNVNGGAGRDLINARIEVDPESRGPVAASVLGGLGNDDLTLAIVGIDPELLDALVDGGAGRDIARVSRGVLVRSCEKVVVLDE